MNYFQWTFDPDCDDMWFLSEPRSTANTKIDSWTFERCQVIPDPGFRLRVSVRRPGREVDAAFGAFDLLYVSPRMAAAIDAVAGPDIQLIPVVVEGSNREIFLVNALREIKCIDERHSKFSKWEAGNSLRPDKVGQYRSFVDLRIDSTQIDNVDVLRPWGWSIALIVSESVKTAAESIDSRGTVFRPVT